MSCLRYCLLLLILASGSSKELFANDLYLNHKVVRGETLTELAKSYYGAAWNYVYLVSANRIKSTADLDIGEDLKVPTSTTHIVNRGESLTQIAKDYYGTTKLSGYIAWANRLKSKSSLNVGQKLKIPFVVRHKVMKKDSLDRIAFKYFRNKKMAARVAKWNDVKSDRDLRKRRYVWMPINKEAKRTGLNVPETPPIVAKEIHKTSKSRRSSALKVPKVYDLSSMLLVSELMKEGKYRRALGILEEIPTSELRTYDNRLNFYWRQTVCAVATGDVERAKQSLRRYQQTAANVGRKISSTQLKAASPKIQQIAQLVAAEAAQKKRK